MKKLIVASLAAIALSCTAVAPAISGESIRLGISPEPYMPFTQINQAGVWDGFEADLSNALCEKMGIECKITQTSWEGLIPSLTAGKIDFIVGAFSITDKRKEVVDFSIPYYNAITVLVGMKADSDKIDDRKDEGGEGMVVDAASLKGKIIGYQSGTIQASYAEKYLGKIKAKAYPAADTALADMTAGRIDYVLMDLQPVETFLSAKGGDEYEVKHEVPGNAILGEGLGYAITKGDKESLDKINNALTALKEDGTLATMINKWFFTMK